MTSVRATGVAPALKASKAKRLLHDFHPVKWYTYLDSNQDRALIWRLHEV